MQRKPTNHETESAVCVKKRGCKRPECVKRYRDYEAWTRRQRSLYGPKKQPARQYTELVRELLDYGYSVDQLAAHYEISRKVIHRLTYEVIDYVEALTAEKLSAPRPACDPEGTIVALKARRQLRALQADGWPTCELLRMMEERGQPVDAQWLTRMLSDRLSKTSAMRTRAVDDMFEKLVLTPGPSKRTANRSLKKGWARPLAWDPNEMHYASAIPDDETSTVQTRRGRCPACLVKVTAYDALEANPPLGATHRRATQDGFCISCSQSR